MLKSVELDYSRISTTDINQTTCDSCGQDKLCLEVDTSEGEYGSVAYCLDCIQNEFLTFRETTKEVSLARETSDFDLYVSSPNWEVRAALVDNPNVPLEILSKLVEDSDYRVATALATSYRTPISILEVLASYGDIHVRCSVASNFKTATATLEKLANDPDWSVRREVAWHPNTPDYVLEKLKNDPNSEVRLSATREWYHKTIAQKKEAHVNYLSGKGVCT